MHCRLHDEELAARTRPAGGYLDTVRTPLTSVTSPIGRRLEVTD
jgi:hypothetical protein